jgi:hypothetical protein
MCSSGDNLILTLLNQQEIIMSTKKIFLGTALAIALAAAGSGFAADEPLVTRDQVRDQTQDQTKTPDQLRTRDEIRAEHLKETAGMTQQERDQYRAQKQAEMTTEQRAAMRASKGGKAGKANGSGIRARDGSGMGSQGAGAGQRMGR